ncbi:hypothetical protein FRC11_014081, partial [Ceratobasidium sp. 423]
CSSKPLRLPMPSSPKRVILAEQLRSLGRSLLSSNTNARPLLSTGPPWHSPSSLCSLFSRAFTLAASEGAARTCCLMRSVRRWYLVT